MPAITKYTLAVLLITFFGIQIGHTVYNKVNWPFCSHNFYYHRSPLVKDVFRIVLVDDQKNQILVDPRHLLPIEGYRCGAIFREVFIQNNNFEKKNSFAQLLLERLNEGGWSGFDERSTPAIPIEGNKFVELSIEKHWIDMRQYSMQKQLVLIKKEVLFTLNKDA